jgi:hypothetical protein
VFASESNGRVGKGFITGVLDEMLVIVCVNKIKLDP